MQNSQKHFDVIIIGAGLSGIGMARQLQDKCPGKSFIILEGRGSIGGTWDLFRYPGIRSDSDMFTMSYANKPWLSDTQMVSDGQLILSYLKEAVEERKIQSHIRFHSKAKTARWSTQRNCWSVEVESSQSERVLTFTGNILMACTGYYKYDQGYTPAFPEIQDFKGTVVHPQHWPENLNYTGKKVVVIGSGATAVTVVPAMAKTAEHVTMLQRSPTYILPWPSRDIFASLVQHLFPKMVAHKIIRQKNIFLQAVFFALAKKYPNFFRRMILSLIRRELPKGFDVEKHFSPRYNPWDQRLCVVPNSDLFKAIAEGRASVITSEIEKFTSNGLLLKSGEELKADIVVTATGLQLQALGQLSLSVDGQMVKPSELFSYKGTMLSNVPNFFYTFGYINASWTLRSEMVADFTCRVINEMDRRQSSVCIPVHKDLSMKPFPMLQEFSSGYIQRGILEFPRQGTGPWTVIQNYSAERKQFQSEAPGTDGVLQFSELRN